VTPARLVELLGGWRGSRPAQEELASALRGLILDGRIPLESPLPAERVAAVALGVSRTTVTKAYNRLRADGYLHSRRGAGSYASVPASARGADDAFVPVGGLDLRVAAPAAPARLQELVADATNTVTVGPASALDVTTVVGERPVWTAPVGAEIACEVQMRAHGDTLPATVRQQDGRLVASLGRAARGIATGQAIVCYEPSPDGDIVLGSATIARAS